VLRNPNHNSDEDRVARPTKEPRDSLERLADFTRRIVQVPKSELPETHKSDKKSRHRREPRTE